MKKLNMSVAILVICGSVVGVASGQNASPRESASAAVPHKVGLIDMARLFKEYKKFEALREGLKAEFESSQGEAQVKQQQIARLQEEMKSFDPSSAEYQQREAKITQLGAELQSFAKIAQRDLFRKESQIYKQVYLEAQDMVKMFAQARNYTLVLRYNNEELDTDDPQKLIQGMNRQVIYHRESDDITGYIIGALNDRYAKSAGASASAPSRARTN